MGLDEFGSILGKIHGNLISSTPPHHVLNSKLSSRMVLQANYQTVGPLQP